MGSNVLRQIDQYGQQSVGFATDLTRAINGKFEFGTNSASTVPVAIGGTTSQSVPILSIRTGMAHNAAGTQVAGYSPLGVPFAGLTSYANDALPMLIQPFRVGDSIKSRDHAKSLESRKRPCQPSHSTTPILQRAIISPRHGRTRPRGSNGRANWLRRENTAGSNTSLRSQGHKDHPARTQEEPPQYLPTRPAVARSLYRPQKRIMFVKSPQVRPFQL